MLGIGAGTALGMVLLACGADVGKAHLRPRPRPSSKAASIPHGEEAPVVATGALPMNADFTIQATRTSARGEAAVEITAVIRQPERRLKRGPAAAVSAPLSKEQPVVLGLLPLCRGPKPAAVVAFGAVRGRGDDLVAVRAGSRRIKFRTVPLTGRGVRGETIFAALPYVPEEIVVRSNGRVIERERYSGTYARLCSG